MSQNRGTLQEQKRKINKKENFKCNPPPPHTEALTEPWDRVWADRTTCNSVAPPQTRPAPNIRSKKLKGLVEIKPPSSLPGATPPPCRHSVVSLS